MSTKSSKTSKGFLKLSRSLLEHPVIEGLPDAQYRLFIKILTRMTYSDCEVDDHGKLVKLRAGQYMFTLRELASESTLSKSSLGRFIQRLVDEKILGQEVGHTKTIVTLLHSDSCELLKLESGTSFGTTVGQDWDKVEDPHILHKNDKSDNKLKNKQKEKIKIREWVSLTTDERDKLFYEHGDNLANEMLDILDAYNTARQEHYKSDYGTLKKGGWVHKEASNRNKPKTPYNSKSVDRRTCDINGVPVENQYAGRF